MIHGSTPWKTLIQHSVSPLAAGTSALEVVGLRPAAEQPAPARPRRTAAVLVGILDHAEPSIVLTRRAQHLEHHPGQVSFPGGAAEAGGETGVATALREAEEEIGLSSTAVQPIGFLDRIDTISDFRVLPVVGLLSHSGDWLPDHRDVEEVFTLPLAMALDQASCRQREIERDGVRHLIYSMDWRGHVIWGVTAAILVNLAMRMERVTASAPG